MSLGTQYRRLWLGSAVSNLGDGVTFVAAPLLAASLTSNPTLIAGVSFAYTAPRVAAALFGGVLVDRMDRRVLLYASNLLRAAGMSVLGVAVLAGLGSMALMYGVFAGLGLLETVADNTAVSVLPSVVRADQLDAANGGLVTVQSVADEFIGPPLGGFLFGLGPALPILLDAGSFAGAALCFSSLRGKFDTHLAEGAGRPSVRAEIAEGARWLARHRLLRALSVMYVLTNVAYIMPFSVLVVYAKNVLTLTDFGYGVVLSVFAFGGLAGAAMVRPAQRLLGRGWTIRGSLLVGAVSYLALAGTTSAVLAAVLLACYALYTTLWSVTVTALRQALVPDVLRGRVNGAHKLLGLLGMSVGALATGPLTASFGPTAPFWVSGALLAATASVFPSLVNNGTVQRELAAAEAHRPALG